MTRCELCDHLESDHAEDSACACSVYGCDCNLGARVTAAGGLSEWLDGRGMQTIAKQRFPPMIKVTP
jgi:hypothetical protein